MKDLIYLNIRKFSDRLFTMKIDLHKIQIRELVCSSSTLPNLWLAQFGQVVVPPISILHYY